MGRATGGRCHLLCGTHYGRAIAALPTGTALAWLTRTAHCSRKARAPCLDQAQHAWKGKSAEIFVLPHHSGHVQRDVTDAMGALVAALARVLSFERGGRVVSGSFGERAMGGATLLGVISGPSEAEFSSLFRKNTSATMPRQKEP